MRLIDKYFLTSELKLEKMDFESAMKPSVFFNNKYYDKKKTFDAITMNF